MSNSADRYITEFAVQAFSRDRKGLLPEPFARARNEAHARGMARRIAEIRAGAVAFARRVDRETEETEDTTIFERIGDLPENLDELLLS